MCIYAPIMKIGVCLVFAIPVFVSLADGQMICEAAGGECYTSCPQSQDQILRGNILACGFGYNCCEKPPSTLSNADTTPANVQTTTDPMHFVDQVLCEDVGGECLTSCPSGRSQIQQFNIMLCRPPYICCNKPPTPTTSTTTVPAKSSTTISPTPLSSGQTICVFEGGVCRSSCQPGEDAILTDNIVRCGFFSRLTLCCKPSPPTTTSAPPSATTVKTTVAPLDLPVLPTLPSSPVVEIAINEESFEVVCTFPRNPNPDDVVHAITWYYGGRNRTKTVQAQETASTLKPNDLVGLRMGQTIYTELVICWKHDCAAETKRYKSNKVRLDMGIPDTLRVVEGSQPVDIVLKPKLPPSFWCGNATCKLMIYSYFSPEEELKCFNTNVYQAVIAKRELPCGTILTDDNWTTEKVISIRATDDGLVDGTRVRFLKLHARFVNASGGVTVIQIKTVNITIKDFRAGGKNVLCSSVITPQMKTFDNKYYSNIFQGDFILYRHKKISQEVQVFYRACNGRATCNCAIAARSRDDVIVIDGCGPIEKAGRHPVKLQAYVNGDMAPDFEVRRFDAGKEYRVYFPTGTYAIVKVVTNDTNNGTTFLNVWMKASAEDAGNAEGLCGNFDSNVRNDFMMRNGTIATHRQEFVLSWRPSDEEKMYSGICPQKEDNCKEFDNSEFCDCTTGRKATCGSNTHVFQCKDNSQSPYQRERQGEDITGSLVGKAINPIGCSMGEEKMNFEFDVIIRKEHSCPTPKGITEDTAKKICTDEITRSPLVQACKLMKTKKLDKLIDNCKKDICLTDDRVWASSILSELRIECKLKEETHVDLWTPDENGELIPSSDVGGLLCTNNCNNHGTCRGGICQCDDGFTMDDCSVFRYEPPVLHGFQGEAFCDTECKSCDRVEVFGETFSRGRQLMCHMTEQENGTDGTTYVVPATFRSFQLVSCNLKNAVSCKISISNWDNIKSNPLIFRVYNSSCETCSDKGCFERNDVCVIDGQCYKPGSMPPKNKKNICFPQVHKKRWSSIESGRKKIVGTVMQMEQLTKRKLLTSAGKFSVSGSPELVSYGALGKVLELQTGNDYITIKSSKNFGCLTGVASSSMGCTIALSVNIQEFCDNMIIISSGGELRKFTGMALFYTHGRLVATVATHVKKWTVSTEFSTLNQFVKLVLSWSMSEGLTFLVNDKVIEKLNICEANDRDGNANETNIVRMGRAIDGTSACKGKLKIGGLNIFPASKTVIDNLHMQIEPAIKGRWTNWEQWSDCSQECDGGIQQRVRECVYPEQYGGKRVKCVGNVAQARLCNKQPCTKEQN